MAYRIAVILLTLRDVQGHSPTASLFKWNVSHSCAAGNKISTAIPSPAVLFIIFYFYFYFYY